MSPEAEGEMDQMTNTEKPLGFREFVVKRNNISQVNLLSGRLHPL